MNPFSVAILLTVFNRKDKTLACLENLFRQIDSLRTDGRYGFSIFMVDDGCTDGTSEAVREAFPQVNIIKSGGNLYWNQGMRLAWKEAGEQDFYLWINDDTLLLDGAVATLLETSEFLRHKAIVVGTTRNEGGALTYGGRTRSNKLINPDSAIPVVCHMFNGNLVLVPKAVYDAVGSLSPAYQHTFGDYDYGLRARKAGISSVVAPGVLAVCERDHGLEPWRDGRYPLRKRYSYLSSPKGRPLKEQFLFDTRLMGFFYAIGHFMSVNFKVLFPKKSS